MKSKHTIGGVEVKISKSLEKDILDDFKYLLSLKKNGLNLFFTDIDKIKEIIKEEAMISS